MAREAEDTIMPSRGRRRSLFRFVPSSVLPLSLLSLSRARACASFFALCSFAFLSLPLLPPPPPPCPSLSLSHSLLLTCKHNCSLLPSLRRRLIIPDRLRYVYLSKETYLDGAMDLLEYICMSEVFLSLCSFPCHVSIHVPYINSHAMSPFVSTVSRFVSVAPSSSCESRGMAGTLKYICPASR